MRVLVAGATGAIGRPLVRQLLEHEHEVYGLTRSESSARKLRALGAVPLLGDARDAVGVRRLLASARPEVIANELTSLPKQLNPKKLTVYYADNNLVRIEGTEALIDAAIAEGVRRFVSQSAAFWYAADNPGVVADETMPFDERAPEPIGEAVRTMRTVEGMVRSARGLESVNLRYGTFYGPGTWFARDGEVGLRVRKWQYPIVGDGRALSSFVHVEDAAAATVAAIEGTATGDFNIVDDDPAPAREWLPAFAAALGGRKPLRIPKVIVRMAIGPGLVHMATKSQGASNARARDLLVWVPARVSWRSGFTELHESTRTVSRAGCALGNRRRK
ncbi:MAG: NAD(P)-dependent oxidoreductase [Dehalococcoidia bacterium]|nr:MAG: NAD(P)-dependent oxidoreductase [Dehalococcoidia bacterium]